MTVWGQLWAMGEEASGDTRDGAGTGMEEEIADADGAGMEYEIADDGAGDAPAPDGATSAGAAMEEG